MVIYHGLWEVGFHVIEGSSSYQHSCITYTYNCEYIVPDVGPASGSIASIFILTGPLGGVALGSTSNGIVVSAGAYYATVELSGESSGSSSYALTKPCNAMIPTIRSNFDSFEDRFL